MIGETRGTTNKGTRMHDIIASNIRTTQMELRDLDLNLLLVFAELIRERSVSKAAENLGMSQPGMKEFRNRSRPWLANIRSALSGRSRHGPATSGR